MNGNGGRGVHLESTYLGRGSSRKRMFVYRERGAKISENFAYVLCG